MLELVDKKAAELPHWVPGHVRELRRAAHRRAARAARVAWAHGQAQQEQLFPGGVPAEGQHVMNLVARRRAVGVLWMGGPSAASEDTWYVFYVEIDEAHRGQGLGAPGDGGGRGVDGRARRPRIALNVFGPNAVARSLYDSLGYQVMATSMYKDL